MSTETDGFDAVNIAGWSIEKLQKFVVDSAKELTKQAERDFHRQALADIIPNAAQKEELLFPQGWVQMWIKFDYRLLAERDALAAENKRMREALHNAAVVLTAAGHHVSADRARNAALAQRVAGKAQA